ELTHADDRFLSLGERTAIANRAHAALFVSIHLNSSPDASASGIGAYYLNTTTDRATIRLARMENGAAGPSSDRAEANLNYVLTDLRQGYKANEAVALAQMIETESVAAADAQGVRLRALGAIQGPFYVLVGAEMPSVLIECGFLSNADEARRLSAGGYQEALADGIGTAVLHYLRGDEAVGNL
ncbi:MAG: N-acetylmuramoyl-L-alanine amidase family protein, partial [Candidatus Binataceae bacterium]